MSSSKRRKSSFICVGERERGGKGENREEEGRRGKEGGGRRRESRRGEKDEGGGRRKESRRGKGGGRAGWLKREKTKGERIKKKKASRRYNDRQLFLPSIQSFLTTYTNGQLNGTLTSS